MNLAVCLLAYTTIVAVLGPALLLRATRGGGAPRLAVTVWLAAMASVLAAWVAALALFATQIVQSWGQLGHVLTGCLAGLRMVVHGGYGGAVQITVAVLAALAALAMVGLVVRVANALRRSRRGTNNHIRAARIAAGGSPPGPGGALVIESPRRAVYCLAGRQPTIVITRAALQALDDAQLAAVISHEQAHLTGRHHTVLAVTSVLSRALYRVRLFSDGAREVARLLEMCADDAAARRHSADTVVDALLALTLPTPTAPTPAPIAAMPAPALSVAGSGVPQRVQRLLFPPDQLRARITLSLAASATLLGPVVTASLLIAVPALCI
ncbi:MAG: M56 family metallopeptidase [Actinomycetia bacterium]|nr:M56 family metallopeptidase [Actinomycetes bacterium]